MYDEELRKWTKVPIPYVHAAKEGKPIYIKLAHVTNCHGFDDILAATKCQPVTNIRNNLKQNHAYICSHINAGRSQKSSSTSSNGESDMDETRQFIPTIHQNKIHQQEPSPSTIKPSVKLEPVTTRELASHVFPIMHKHGGPSTLASAVKAEPVDLETVELTDNDLESSDNALVSAAPKPKLLKWKWIPTSSPILSISPPPGKDTDDPIIVDEDQPLWPSEFCFCDIIQGFRVCRQAKDAGENVAAPFTSLYSIPFVFLTLYDNKNRWEDAPQVIIDKVMKAGCTPQSTWPTFTHLLKPATKPGRKCTSRAATKRCKAGSP
jgi:hypothetical protein